MTSLHGGHVKPRTQRYTTVSITDNRSMISRLNL